MKNAIVLLNGKAGNNFGKRNAFKIIEQINSEGYETLVVPVGAECKTDLREVLLEHKDSIDVCVSVGGDGTLHHTVNTLLKNSCSLPIVYLPCGTTNDFARSLGLIDRVSTGGKLIGTDTMKLDAGLFNQEYFTYVAAFGALTDVSYNTTQEAKNILGYTAYALNSLQSIPSGLSSRIHAKVESKEFSAEGEYLYGSVSNCYSVAGVQSPLLEDVMLNDGLFEVVLIKAPDNAGELFEIASTLLSGNIDDKNNHHVTMFRTSKVSFAFEDKTEWTLDGEYGGTVKNAAISVKKGKIVLLK